MKEGQIPRADKAKAPVTSSASDWRITLYHERMNEILVRLGMHNYSFNGIPNTVKVPDSLRPYFKISQKDDGSPNFKPIDPGTPEHALMVLQDAVDALRSFNLKYPPKWLNDADLLAEPLIDFGRPRINEEPKNKIPEPPPDSVITEPPRVRGSHLASADGGAHPSERLPPKATESSEAAGFSPRRFTQVAGPIVEKKISGLTPAELHTGLTLAKIKQGLFEWLKEKDWLMLNFKKGPRMSGSTLTDHGGAILSYIIDHILKLEKLDPQIPEIVTQPFLNALGLSGFQGFKYRDTLWKLGYIDDEGWKQHTAKHLWPRLEKLKAAQAKAAGR